jgi:pSer/pThr/pTyr-binding forkhead associated (FHA) protein
MSWFSRRSGKKDEQKEQGDKEPSAEVEAAARGATMEASSEQVFGLKFIFESGESKTFTSLPISIGRSEQNQIVLGDKSVSATHARVYYDDRVRGICIVDTDSLNGLYINDQPTSRNTLQDGVKIRLGNVHLVFRDTGYIHPGSE